MRKVNFDDATARVEIDITQTGSGLRGDVMSSVEEVRTHLDIVTSASEADINEVVRIAHNSCFMEQMIAKPTPVSQTLTIHPAGA